MIMQNIIADLCIYILTWNVATKSPRDLDLMSMLSLNGTSSCPNGQLPDMYVIGLQEVNTEAKHQIQNLFNDNEWTFHVQQQLELHQHQHQYLKVDTEQMQGLLVMLFVQRQHIPHMQDIEVKSTRTGLGGLWGNKGAVSIRMSLYGTGVIFVCAHLAAHDNKLNERIEDYNQIVENHHYKVKNYRTIFDHDFVFWFGDLNFRLTGEDSAWDVRTEVEQQKYAELLTRDQLLLVRETGNAFGLLNETLPTFAPTFKFIEGSSEYNLKRRPAWCDRILYRVDTYKYPDIKLIIEQLSYNSHPEYTLSDHKPVSSEFMYKIEAESLTDQDLHVMTHSAAGTDTPLASVIIMSFIAFISINLIYA